MLTKLKARKAEIARLREERGATDPILIIAGIAITLILLVGGSFAISGFIANANNLNAKGDLDRIATAQAAYLAAKQRDCPRPQARRLQLLASSQLAEPLPFPGLSPPLDAGMRHKPGRAA